MKFPRFADMLTFLFFTLATAMVVFLGKSQSQQTLSIKVIHEKPQNSVPDYHFDDFLYALAAVESSNRDDAVGDQGKALGRFQIHENYWKDAVEHQPELGRRGYQDVTDPAYARQIVLAYFDRYGRAYVATEDWESLARLHNGGPSIFRKKETKAWENTSRYWQKVKGQLDAN